MFFSPSFAFSQACGKFINNNFVTKQAQSSSKSPELLARYCDSLLKKRSVIISSFVINKMLCWKIIMDVKNNYALKCQLSLNCYNCSYVLDK